MRGGDRSGRRALRGRRQLCRGGAQRRLVFTWAWHSTPERESLVTVELRAEGDGTALTLTHERFFDEAARDRHREGWSGALDKLAQLFA